MANRALGLIRYLLLILTGLGLMSGRWDVAGTTLVGYGALLAGQAGFSPTRSLVQAAVFSRSSFDLDVGLRTKFRGHVRFGRNVGQAAVSETRTVLDPPDSGPGSDGSPRT